MHIASPNNSKLKLVKRLRGKRGRAAEARFVIDSRRDLRRALALGYEAELVLLCADTGGDIGDPGCEIATIAPQLLQGVSYRENPDGVLAVMRSKLPRGRHSLETAAARNAIALVDLRVPGNIGALMRSADASGMDAVILVDCALDLYNPNIIRSSTAACFLDNIYQLSTDEALDYFRGADMEIVAADPRGHSLHDADFAHSTAIVLGAEDRGLSDKWLQAAGRRVGIPMAGRVADSLNVSASGAILMFEMQRQRKERT